jgi:hypothetical protein
MEDEKEPITKLDQARLDMHAWSADMEILKFQMDTVGSENVTTAFQLARLKFFAAVRRYIREAQSA